jgi:hypothetical protein
MGLTAIILVLLLALVLAACSGPASNAASPGLLDQAAAEATAIVGQAQATALVLQAHAQATAVMAQVQTFNQGATPTPARSAALRAEDQIAATPEAVDREENEPKPTPLQTVEVLSVGFAGEGGMIHVQFLAPPAVTTKWWQGSVVVTDEATGAIYNEIPVMPKIGPLIGRPKRDGQIGYVMLVNAPPGLRSGAMVTVALGNYTFEHILVE